MKNFILITLAVSFFVLISTPAFSQETDDVDPVAELKAAADYFHNIDIGEFSCDVKIVFDASDQYDKEDIERWKIAKGTYEFIGHYYYREGGIFEARVFGETVASNAPGNKKQEAQSTIVVPLIPVPGGVRCDEEILEQYDISYRGEEIIDDFPCYQIRLDSKDDKSFMNRLDYYIDKKEKVIRKAKCNFKWGSWEGNAFGEFYYKKKRGKLLPNVAYGSIYYRKPVTWRMALWGKWSGFKMKSLEEIEKEEMESEKEPQE